MQPPVFDDMIFHDPGQNEDCLTLNIWTPVKEKNEKLPVMVWIYGGGFTGGTTSEARQDGENLAHKGVIVVSMCDGSVNSVSIPVSGAVIWAAMTPAGGDTFTGW